MIEVLIRRRRLLLILLALAFVKLRVPTVAA